MDFSQKKRDALLKSRFANPRTKVGDEYITGLTCPSCGCAEAYAYTRDPNAIICNRRNKCGAVTPLRSACPDFFQNFERDFKPTKEDPERPATEFLRARGLQGSLKGLKYRYFERTREGCCGAVMFPVGEKDGKAVFNGRLFNPPPGAGKTHNVGSTSGLYWCHSAIQYEPKSKPTYVVEGIIDALSLIEMGHQAIAVLSSGSDPKKLIGPLLDGFKWIVLAFDNDPAGHKALRKWRACLGETIKARNLPNQFSAIMLPRGDFNDFLLSGPLEKVKKEFASREPEFTAFANLATATSPKDWATIHFSNFGDEGAVFLFEFNRCYHSTKLKTIEDQSGPHKVVDSVRKISNFTFKRRHRLLGFRGSDDLEFEHQFKILKPKT